MSDPVGSTASSRSRDQIAPHRIALTILWIVAAAAIIVMLLHDVRSTDRYSALRYVLQGSYVAALLWHLGRTGSVRGLPASGPRVLSRGRYRSWVPVLGLSLLLALAATSDDGVDILMLLLIGATAWILVAWRREIRLRSVVQGIAVALVAYLAGLPAAHNGLLSETAILLLPALAAPMYVAGGMLFDRTRLGGIQLLAGRYGEVPKSVLRGCLLFVPLGLFNAAEGSPGLDITWVTEWWMPLTLPWFSGIAEEIWWRLLVVGLCFFVLLPSCRTRPALAAVAAVLFSGITFGLGHGRTVDNFLTTGLLYGVPMAAVFAKRDWEHAVGAHYVVNLIPWVMVFLET